jgi:trk system potassium uptake protein TrkH
VNLRLDVEILGWLLVGVAGAQLPAAAFALTSGEAVRPFLESATAALVCGLSVALSARGSDRRLRPRDGFLVVTGAWLLACSFGALPYVLSGRLAPVDAFFETASGFTTTGSTVLSPIEGTPAALLLWRSLTQWLGGMGIIVFAIAVLPLLGIGGMKLFQAEVPGPVADKLTPRIADTARRLWIIYAGLTMAAVVALWLAGMGLFDAINHAFTALSTGGFSTRDASLAAFSPAAQWVMIAFMIAAGANFLLHWRLVTGRAAEVASDEELRFYLGTIAALVAAMAWVVWRAGSEPDPLRASAFQVVSLLTTTGYGSADYERWPPLGHLLVLVLLVLGGMSGSTAGGLKTVRLQLGLRKLRAALAQTTHRRALLSVSYGGRPVVEDVLSGIFAFFTAYFAIAAVGALVVASAGYDAVTALSASLTALGNVGPGLGDVGPTENFAHLPGYAKLWLALAMIAGRLEIFTFLLLLHPRFWRP